MIPTLHSAIRSRQRWRRARSSRERGIRWLTLIGSPVSGSGIRHAPAASCCRSKSEATKRAAPAKAGCAATSDTRSSPTQIRRSSLSAVRNSLPVRAGMAAPILAPLRPGAIDFVRHRDGNRAPGAPVRGCIHERGVDRRGDRVSGGPRALVAVLVAALSLAACDGRPLSVADPGSLARNPTVLENEKEGSADWEITATAEGGEIEGYASATSVEGGGAIDLFVSTLDPDYRIDVFRMGWYGGAGARRAAGPIVRPGIRQPVPLPDPTTGLVECRWREPYHLPTADAAGPWPSGGYLARLTASPSGRQAYIVFVVRDDERRSALLFQSSVTP